MLTFLQPLPNNPHLSVSEILGRLRASFPVVDVDEREGLLFVSERVMRQSPRASHEELDSLITPLADAVLAIVADDPKSDRFFVRTFVIPGEPIVIDWDDAKHARRCQSLLSRYAQALNYEVVDLPAA